MDKTKLTKIVATIGPSTEKEDKIEELIRAGVNVFRFNTKHSTPAWHDEHIKLVQSVADRMGVTIGILLDLQGPEVRLETRDQRDISVSKGQTLVIGSSFVDGIDVIIPHIEVFRLLKPGGDLLIDDGFVESEIMEVGDTTITVKILGDAVIKNRKGVNLPGVDIDFPSLIDRDIAQLDANARNKVDFVGLSFVRSAHDIALLRAEMVKRGMNAMIVGKIENQPALDRLDEIIHEADAIMVARGDLGVEVPFEQLSYWQRTIIDLCRKESKPVITATQMLESMIKNPRPTRAEVTDVANAIYEGTDATMLSGETAGGSHPVKTVEVMARIARWNEGKRRVHKVDFDEQDATSNIASAAVSIVNSKLKPTVDKLVVFTETGYTARAIAKHRLKIPVIAVTDEKGTADALTLSYGITPIYLDQPIGKFSKAEDAIEKLVRQGVLTQGEHVVVVHGQHLGKSGNTNAIVILKL